MKESVANNASFLFFSSVVIQLVILHHGHSMPSGKKGFYSLAGSYAPLMTQNVLKPAINTRHCVE